MISIDRPTSGVDLSMKSVRFHNIEIYELPIVLGANPSVSRGPPLEIGWELLTKTEMNLASYEKDRPPRRKTKELVVSHFSRVNFLLWCGYTQQEIDEATTMAEGVRKMRFLTQLSNKCRGEEKSESNSRLAKSRLTSRFDIVPAKTKTLQAPVVPTRASSPTVSTGKKHVRMARKASLDSLIQCPVRKPSPSQKQRKRASWGASSCEPNLPIPERKASPVSLTTRKTVMFETQSPPCRKPKNRVPFTPKLLLSPPPKCPTSQEKVKTPILHARDSSSALFETSPPKMPFKNYSSPKVPPRAPRRNRAVIPAAC